MHRTKAKGLLNKLKCNEDDPMIVKPTLTTYWILVQCDWTSCCGRCRNTPVERHESHAVDGERWIECI